MAHRCYYCGSREGNPGAGIPCASCWEVTSRLDAFLRLPKGRRYVLDKLWSLPNVEVEAKLVDGVAALEAVFHGLTPYGPVDLELQTAQGEGLDYLAHLVGLERHRGEGGPYRGQDPETDVQLRERIVQDLRRWAYTGEPLTRPPVCVDCELPLPPGQVDGICNPCNVRQEALAEEE